MFTIGYYSLIIALTSYLITATGSLTCLHSVIVVFLLTSYKCANNILVEPANFVIPRTVCNNCISILVIPEMVYTDTKQSWISKPYTHICKFQYKESFSFLNNFR